MTDKKSNFLSKLVVDIVTSLFSLLKIIPTVTYIIEMEARDVGKNLVWLMVLMMISGVLLTSIWVGILAMCVVYLVSLNLGWMLSLLIVVVINILLLIITALIIANTKHDLSFEKTRELLHHINK